MRNVDDVKSERSGNVIETLEEWADVPFLGCNGAHVGVFNPRGHGIWNGINKGVCLVIGDDETNVVISSVTPVSHE